MKGSIISIVLLALVIAAVSFLTLIIKNKRLSLNGKIFWAAIVIFLPIVGGVVYFTRKGETNA